MYTSSEIWYYSFWYFCRNLFLTEEDITSLPNFRVWTLMTSRIFSFPYSNIPMTRHFIFVWLLQNQTVIAIQAPRASFLEVPDPDEVGNWIILVHTFLTIFCWFLNGAIYLRILVSLRNNINLLWEARLDLLMFISWGTCIKSLRSWCIH